MHNSQIPKPKEPSQKAKLQAVWLKALREGEVRQAFNTSADAARARFALYNAVKGVRAGREVSPELSQALAECTLLIRDNLLIIRHRSRDSVFQALNALVEGEMVQEALSQEEAEIAASQQRLLDKLTEQGLSVGNAGGTSAAPEMPAPGTRVTPYYTR